MFYLELVIVLAITLWLWSGLKKLDVGWKSEVLFLGKRTGVIFGEGWSFAPWPFEIKAQDCRDKTLKLGNIEAITKDNAKVIVGSTIIYRVVDLHKFFGVNPAGIEQALDEARSEMIRATIREHELENALNLHTEISKLIQARVEHSEWGIDITKVMIPDILPDPKILEAMELKKKEELEQAGQHVEAHNFAGLVNYLSSDGTLGDKGPKGPGLSKELANEAALLLIGKAEPKKVASHTFSFDSAAIAAAVSAVTQAVIARK